MLRGKNNDLLHLLTMVESLEKIIIYTDQAKDAESFYELNDQLNFNAVLNLLTHVGETVKQLSNDLLIVCEDVDWEKIKGLRNRIAHDYLGLNTLIIYQICEQNVPKIIKQLYPIIKSRVEDGTFDIEELKVANGSIYYRHIKFEKLKTK